MISHTASVAVYAVLALSSLPCAFAQDDDSKDKDRWKFAPLEEVLLAPKLNDSTLESIHAKYKREFTEEEKSVQEKIRKARIEAMKKRDPKFDEKDLRPEDDPSGFQWNSSSQDLLRADPKTLTFLGERVGEVVIRGKGPQFSSAMISLFNRGDDKEISPGELTALAAKWSGILSEKLGSKPTARDTKGAVNITGLMWKKERIAWLLESSIGKESKEDGGNPRAEFLRIKVASLDAIIAPTTSTGANRFSLRGNVTITAAGDILIQNVPMVDQGQKGYCAVATLSRLAGYYKIDVDQHEMAQAANSGAHGTSMDEMEEAFKKNLGKLHLRANKIVNFEERRYIADLRAYNQMAKKAGKKTFQCDRDGMIANPLYVFQEADKELWAQMKEKNQAFGQFTGKVEEYVKQGIPLCWCLYLGMFKEEGLPQTSGGHMRMIIGYNPKTKEILYTDSWGKGHELKRMPAIHAWCMTTNVYVVAPTR